MTERDLSKQGEEEDSWFESEDRVCLVGGHVNPRTWFGRDLPIVQTDSGSTGNDLQDRRVRGGVLGQFLVDVEPENHEADVIILVEHPAEGAVLGDFKFR